MESFDTVLFEENPLPLVIWEIVSSKIKYVNTAAINFFGYTRAEFIDKNLFDLFYYSGPPNLFDIRQYQAGAKAILGQKYVLKNGAIVVVDIKQLDIVIHGQQLRFMMIVDTTERYDALIGKQQSDHLVESIALNFPNGIISIVDRNSRFYFVDGQEIRKLGLSPKAMIGTLYIDIMDVPNQAYFLSNLQKIIQNGHGVFEIEYGGSTFMVSGIIISTQGADERILLVSQNITKSIEAQKEITFQANILQNVDDAIAVKNMDGTIVYWNSGASKLFGYTPEEIIGTKSDAIVEDDSGKINLHHYINKIIKDGSLTGVGKVIKKDGSRIFVESKQNLMHDENGMPAYIIGISKDVTARITAELVLKESEANLKAIFQSTRQSFILLDTEATILAFNKNASDAIKNFYNHNLKVGDNFKTFILPESKGNFQNHFVSVLNKETVRFEQRYDFPAKKSIYLQLTYSPVIKENEVIGVILCVEDITSQYLIKKEIEKSELRYRELVETSNDIIWTIENDGTITFVNQAVKDILGWGPEDMLGKKINEFLPAYEWITIWQVLNQASLNKTIISNNETNVLTKDGKEIITLTNALVRRNEKGEAIGFTGTTSDITVAKLAEKELKDVNIRLRLLTSHLQMIREDERLKISREIHDELGQQLTGLKMDLAWIKRKIHSEQEEVGVKVSEMMQMVDETVKSVRKIASDLRPGILDDLGLAAAIEWQCQDFVKRTSISCEFHNQIEETTFPMDIATGVFRILQESLTNIARHSKATKVRVFLEEENDKFFLHISDNGTGFDQLGIDVKKTLGIIGMKERANMLHAKLTIESKNGKGTHLELSFNKHSSDSEPPTK